LDMATTSGPTALMRAKLLAGEAWIWMLEEEISKILQLLMTALMRAKLLAGEAWIWMLEEEMSKILQLLNAGATRKILPIDPACMNDKRRL